MAERLSDNQLPIRSYFVVWGHDRKPKVKGSHWEVGYTPAHQPNEDLAIAYALQQKINEIDRIRRDWILLTLLAGEHVADNMEREGEMAEARLGLPVPADGISVIKAEDGGHGPWLKDHQRYEDGCKHDDPAHI